MTLNEIILIGAVVALLVIPSLLAKHISQPLITYVDLITGLLLLILVWGFAGDGSLPLRIIVTTVVIKSVIKTTTDYKKFSRYKEMERL